MPDKILGLDIGDSSVKAVQVLGGLKGSQVTACARVEIDPQKGLEDALGRLFEEIPVNNGACISSFQAHLASYRNLAMPFKDKKKIGRTIGYELEPMLPFSVENLTTDYIFTERSDHPKILTASIKKQAFAEYLAALAAHQVNPEAVDLGSVPTAMQIVKDDDEPADALFIDMGAKVASVILCRNRAVALVRSLPFGGDAITAAIAETQNISREEAERRKCEGSVDGFAEGVKPVIRSLCHEIQNTLHAFRHQVTEEVNPQKVFLTGGGALYPGIAAMVQEFLELPVEMIDLTEKLHVEMEEGALEHWNPLFMNAALSLALRDSKAAEGFNFRTGEFKKQRRYDLYMGDIKRAAIYVAVILLVLLVDVGADYYVLKKRHSQFQQQITSIFKETFPEVERIVDPAHQMRVKLREAKESMLLPTDAVGQGMVVDVLRDIAMRIPEDADVDAASLVIDEDRARLKGLTDNFNTVDVVKNALEGSDFFKDVSIASAQLDRSGDRVRFELVMGRK
jgi:type IV pilus assembly protein PilM